MNALHGRIVTACTEQYLADGSGCTARELSVLLDTPYSTLTKALRSDNGSLPEGICERKREVEVRSRDYRSFVVGTRTVVEYIPTLSRLRELVNAERGTRPAEERCPYCCDYGRCAEHRPAEARLVASQREAARS